MRRIDRWRDRGVDPSPFYERLSSAELLKHLLIHIQHHLCFSTIKLICQYILN